MTLSESLKALAIRFRGILDVHEGHMECFCRHGVQLEGWLKGELLVFLDGEKASGRIVGFDREVALDEARKKVDFRVNALTSSGSQSAWLELKHWLIGYQKGTRYNAQFYFGDPTSVGIRPDAEKLNGIQGGGRYLFVLATANPGVPDWSSGVEKFNSKFSPLRLESLTSPTEFPDSYFLGLLSV